LPSSVSRMSVIAMRWQPDSAKPVTMAAPMPVDVSGYVYIRSVYEYDRPLAAPVTTATPGN
jgi:hypothetical protein